MPEVVGTIKVPFAPVTDVSGLKNCVVRVLKNKNKVYYFDEHGIYRSMSYNNELGSRLSGVYDGERYNEYTHKCKGSYGTPYFNLRVSKVLAQLKEGDTLDKFLYLLNTMEVTVNRYKKPTGVDRFITVEDIQITRFPENQNVKTFDLVAVMAYVIRSENTMQYIKENVNDIVHLVLSKIEKDKYFKKYGVPVNILKLTNMTYSQRINMIRFVFEVKEPKRDWRQ